MRVSERTPIWIRSHDGPVYTRDKHDSFNLRFEKLADNSRAISPNPVTIVRGPCYGNPFPSLAWQSVEDFVC